MAKHIVQSGETLTSIARVYGYPDYRMIWDHPENAGLRQKRPNPNLIFPGDVVVVPNKNAPIAASGPHGDDNFESAEYNINYRSVSGHLSKFIKAKYKNAKEKDIDIDSITEAQPNLWHAKQEALKVMDDYNASFILGSAFPVVFQVLTMATSITPVADVAPTRQIYRATRGALPTAKAAGNIIESTGAIKPGGVSRMHTDPFTGETHPIMATAQTERSLITSIRADVAESEAYKAALLRGEIGLQRPTGANVTGSDFITAVLRVGTRKVEEVLVTDVKASVANKFPVPKAVMPGSWHTELRGAVAPGRLNLGDPALESEIRLAVQQGRVRLRQLNVNYSPQGRVPGQITGW